MIGQDHKEAVAKFLNAKKAFDFEVIASQIEVMELTNGLEGRMSISFNNKQYYCRLSKLTGESSMTEELSSFLQASGSPVLVNQRVGGKLILNSDEYDVEVRTLQKGIHYQGQSNQLYLLAEALFQLHVELKKFPLSDKFIKSSKAYNVELEKVQELIKQKSPKLNKVVNNWLNSNADFVENNLLTLELNFIEGFSPQCVHGDLHPGNVLFNSEDVWFLDFEESYKTFASVNYDIGYLIIRYALPSEDSEKVYDDIYQRLRAMYGSQLLSREDLLKYGTKIVLRLMLMAIYNGLTDNKWLGENELNKFKNQFELLNELSVHLNLK
ncbi:MAG: Ser/Thr protein kinase RdoA (MazF antagonist) [Parvicellaceae bacterium]|jgi:Ser/Thr protein kinase RdoA (MazF antagonist)